MKEPRCSVEHSISRIANPFLIWRHTFGLKLTPKSDMRSKTMCPLWILEVCLLVAVSCSKPKTIAVQFSPGSHRNGIQLIFGSNFLVRYQILSWSEIYIRRTMVKEATLQQSARQRKVARFQARCRLESAVRPPASHKDCSYWYHCIPRAQ